MVPTELCCKCTPLKVIRRLCEDALDLRIFVLSSLGAIYSKPYVSTYRSLCGTIILKHLIL